jgi:glutamate formiminotransferase
MIEAVPNISEGRDGELIARIATAVQNVPSVFLLNVHSDADHNRSVFTYASESAEAIMAATLALYELALAAIDLRTHRGAHPRVGAVDVCPFVPLRGSTMEQCVALALAFGGEIASRHQLPVYLYEEAAAEEWRRELPLIRSGQFEKFPEKIADPRWKPDFGPEFVHESAGVTVVGARLPLIAFNVQLGTDQIEVAEKIARAVRHISGGLRFVRALPIALTRRGIVQVSMNLLDYRRTPLHRAFGVVKEEAERWGVPILSTEIVGLVPADALYAVAEHALRIGAFHPSSVLERRIADTLAAAQPSECDPQQWDG